MDKAKMINDAVISTAVRKAEERGKHKVAVEIAANLLKMGISVEKIAAGTGLTVEKIEKLRDALL